MPALCTGCLCVSQENSDSAGDDIRYSRLCSLPRPARWVLFGGTEPVKEGNVTQSGEREAGRAVHITRECSQWFTVSVISSHLPFIPA